MNFLFNLFSFSGYIPAENIETPFEKLARFNRSRNVELTEVKNMDLDKQLPKKQRVKKLKFMEYVTEIYEDEEIETELSANPEKNRKRISSTSLSDNENMLVGKSSTKKSSFMNVREWPTKVVFSYFLLIENFQKSKGESIKIVSSFKGFPS